VEIVAYLEVTPFEATKLTGHLIFEACIYNNEQQQWCARLIVLKLCQQRLPVDQWRSR